MGADDVAPHEPRRAARGRELHAVDVRPGPAVSRGRLRPRGRRVRHRGTRPLTDAERRAFRASAFEGADLAPDSSNTVMVDPSMVAVSSAESHVSTSAHAMSVLATFSNVSVDAVLGPSAAQLVAPVGARERAVLGELERGLRWCRRRRPRCRPQRRLRSHRQRRRRRANRRLRCRRPWRTPRGPAPPRGGSCR